MCVVAYRHMIVPLYGKEELRVKKRTVRGGRRDEDNEKKLFFSSAPLLMQHFFLRVKTKRQQQGDHGPESHQSINGPDIYMNF